MEFPANLIAAGIAVDGNFAPGDLGELIRLHGIGNQRDYGFNAVHEAYCARIAADYIVNGGGARGRVWLARREGRVIGSIFIVETTDRLAQLRLLYVDASARGLGLGRWLVEAAVEHCRAAGFAGVFLWTVAGLDRAIHLYAALGFIVTDAKPTQGWGAAVDEIRYELKL